jgi:hypothetical protein
LTPISIVVLAAHLVLADLAAAGPLVCVWLQWRVARRGDLAAQRVGRRLAAWSLGALLAAAVLGGALFGLVALRGDSHVWSAAAALRPSRWWFAGVELAFSLVLLTAYAWLWRRPVRSGWLRAVLAIASSTNLLYHFPVLFTIVGTLARRGPPAAGSVDSAAYRALLIDPEVLSKVVHVWLASLAVAGIAVMLAAARAARDETLREAAQRIGMGGARLALAVTLAQMLVGLWVVTALPATSRYAVLGGQLPLTGLFAAAVFTAIGLVHQLAAGAMGDVDARSSNRAALLLMLTVLLMTGVLKIA